MDEFRGLYSSGHRMSAEDMALGERLIVEASKRGDTETATQLIADVAALGTEMGQAVQALRLIKRMSAGRPSADVGEDSQPHQRQTGQRGQAAGAVGSAIS